MTGTDWQAAYRDGLNVTPTRPPAVATPPAGTGGPGTDWQAVHTAGLAHTAAQFTPFLGSPVTATDIPTPPVTAFYGPTLVLVTGQQSFAAREITVVPAALMPGLNSTYDDAEAINWALKQGDVTVNLVPGLAYHCYSQITVPPGARLRSFNDYRSALGAVLNFYDLTSSAAVTFSAGTPAGAVEGVILDGANLPAGAVDGFGIYLSAKQGSLIDVHTRNFTNHGANITANGGQPDGWFVNKISAHNNAGNGINWDYAVDGTLDTFHLDNNTGHGLAVGTFNNFSAINGRCQQNTLSNYGLTGTFMKASATFSVCGSENSQVDGWDLSGVNGQGIITLQGCWARDEGTSGSSGSGYSGFKFGALGSNMVKSLVSCASYVTLATAGQDYGISLTGDHGWLLVKGGQFAGSVAGFHDGGGNTAAQQFVDNALACTGQDGSFSAQTLKNAWP